MENDPEKLALLASVPTEVESALIVSALLDRGIRAVASGGYTCDFRAEAPGTASVLVESADLDQARAALEEIRREQASIDWSQVDVGEPESN